MKPVQGWKDVYKHISFICMAFYTTAITVFNLLPVPLQQSFDQEELRWFSVGLFIFGMVGKYVDQNFKGNSDD